MGTSEGMPASSSALDLELPPKRCLLFSIVALLMAEDELFPKSFADYAAVYLIARRGAMAQW